MSLLMLNIISPPGVRSKSPQEGRNHPRRRRGMHADRAARAGPGRPAPLPDRLA